MSGLFTTPDTFHYLQRLSRSLTGLILEDENFKIFTLKERLCKIDLSKIDFAKHCGIPKSLEPDQKSEKSATDEGLIGIAGIFTEFSYNF